GQGYRSVTHTSRLIINRFVSLSAFFFQAEDGIRDATVTGVQTCALPISRTYAVPSGRTSSRISSTTRPGTAYVRAPSAAGASRRSEERRVGKEGRCGR